MAKQMGDYTELLLRRGVISLDQLSEAESMGRETGKKVSDCLVQLQYASGEDVMRAMAEHHKLKYVDLDEVSIPENVIELVPESVARENGILPMAEDDDALVVIMSDPLDIERRRGHRRIRGAFSTVLGRYDTA